MATVPASTRSTAFTVAVTSAGPFNIGFRLFDLDSLDVYVDGTRTTAFSIQATFDDGYTDTGTITFTSPVAAGKQVIIDGALTPRREQDYINSNGLTDKLNVELARIWSALAEVKRDSERAARSFVATDPADYLTADYLDSLPEYAAAAAASSLSAAQSADTAVRATTADASLRLRTIAELEASTRANAGVGALWQAGYHLYSEASPSAVDHTETTAGGVKLYALPMWSQPDRFNVGNKPWVNISNAAVPQQKNHLFVRQETATRNDEYTVQIQRVVTTNDGYVNPKALQVITYIQSGGGSQREWALSGVIENSDNTRTGEGGVGTSGVAVKKAAGTGVMFGGHFQVRDETGNAGGSIVGAEVNIVCSGAHDGNRIGIDVIAKTYEPGPSLGYGFAGVRIRGESIPSEAGSWEYGLLVANSTSPVERAIGTRNSPGLSVGAAFDDEGTKQYGMLLKGTYGAAAIRVSAGEFIAFEQTATIKIAYESSDLRLSIFNGANKRFSFEPDPTPRMFINNVQVLQERRTGWTAPTGTASRGAFDPATVTLAQLAERVKALIDDLTAHGLIGT